MNKENMYKVADAIEKGEIAKFNMHNFVARNYDGSEYSCGTAACVGGFTSLLARQEVRDGKDNEHIYCSHQDTAQHYLDLTFEQGMDLFYAYTHDEAIPGVDGNKEHVPAALRWMANNNSVNWDDAFEAVASC